MPRAGTTAEKESQRLWRLAGMGGTLASEIVAGALIGLGLDYLFGTGPTLLVIFTIFGVAIGMTTFLRSALKETRAAGREGARVAARHREEDADAAPGGGRREEGRDDGAEAP